MSQSENHQTQNFAFIYTKIHLHYPISRVCDKSALLVSTGLLYNQAVTFEKSRIINRTGVHILISHLVFVPAVKANIFLPLFEPATIH